jgi:probable rRNA maturation factor
LSTGIYYDNTGFRLKDSRRAGKVIEKVIRKQGRISDDLNFIITDDETLYKINKEFLKHDYFTDVITFNYNVDGKINGEVYISIDTVKRNAANYKVSLKSEIIRVMMHGILHLLGYDDKEEVEKRKMKEMEEILIDEFNELINEL